MPSDVAKNNWRSLSNRQRNCYRKSNFRVARKPTWHFHHSRYNGAEMAHAEVPNPTRLSGSSSRRQFFWSAVLIAVLVFAGFSRTYFLHVWFGTPNLSRFLHLHALVMSSWILFFLVQTFLISARRIKLHQNLGFFRIVSALSVVTLGVSATVLAARREVLAHAHDAPIAIIVLALELTQMLMFSGFVVAGFWLRHRAAYHKRLMLLATFCMLPNAIVRIVRVPSFVVPLYIWSLLIVTVVLVDCAIH